MQIILIKAQRLYRYPFPTNDVSNFWITDLDDNDNERNLINLEKNDVGWVLKSNEITKIIENKAEIESAPLYLDKFYFLKVNNKLREYMLYVNNPNNPRYKTYEISAEGEFTIGSSSKSAISVTSSFIRAEHAVLKYRENNLSIESLDKDYGIYVNDIRVAKQYLQSGDVIFIMGLKIVVIGNRLVINTLNDTVKVNSNSLLYKPIENTSVQIEETIDDDNVVLYEDNQYFSRAPRFSTSIEDTDFPIDPPPSPENQEDMPLLYTLGPMLTMGMTSAITAWTAINNMNNGNATLSSSLPTLVISGSMLASVLVWPTLMRRFQKKKKKEREAQRQVKYANYLAEKRKKIETMKIQQHQIMMENFIDPKDCQIIVLNKKRNLWERKRENDDFLTCRVGTGTIPLRINLKYSEEGFSMIDDNLKAELYKVVDQSKDIKNAPVTVSLTERNKLVIVGETQYKDSIIKSLILQISTYHSYDDVKFVFMMTNPDSSMWEDFKTLPHSWSNSRDIRFYANNYGDMNKLSFYLEQVFNERKGTNEDSFSQTEKTFRDVSPYYVIFVDNIKKAKNIEIINKILKEKNNLGFSIIVLNDGISNLPNECTDFLMVDGDNSAIIKNDLNKNNQQGFIMDNVSTVNMPLICEKLAGVPIKFTTELDEVKTSVGFLEMYKVGRVEQLNCLNRWNKNNPVNSLSVPIGILPDHEIFTLDLHEKFHGPHGLIAGMTGSGKSEFIITFILSMCVNFNPNEVSFVLIDYKGGGLTGAFENKETGVVLPHLAGTITNLDTVEMKRALASIQSELRRRQNLFNKAKTKLNESTIDIYKYQKLFRDGSIDEPMSHLFIISDEFAELKKQQPEFMTELISTARIGRSLGVHLILATQKPSGIVDDQIWSNSKFRVCLKVQEKSDSMDVIKRPDAAALKKAGRFYLQVGYNDYFAMGQAAWAGTQYYPADKINKVIDRSLSILNDIGDVVKTVECEQKVEIASQGEELPNILKYICEMSNSKNYKVDKLWLDRIPDEIFVSDLIAKYGYTPVAGVVNPVIGEYDDPQNQRQGLLTLDLNDKGNTIIYGSTGSGKEVMLSTIIYSSIIYHKPDEINFYILDFGSETLRMFKKAPQVGDVILITETEKVNNLFKVISLNLEQRKKLFIDYNGDFVTYNQNNEKKIPRIVVVINNYEAFYENYEDFSDTVASLSREGERYGIDFIITSSSSTGIRTKIAQNFSQLYCLQFNDSGDYSSILGPVRGMIPSNATGRGLIKLNNEIYEFQTAYPYKWDNISEYIKSICQKLHDNINVKANEIAILPDQVGFDHIKDSINSLSSVPIGVEKEKLIPALYDLTKSKISIISAQDTSAFDHFLPSFINVLENIPNVNLCVFDANEVMQKHEGNYKYLSNNFSDIYNEFKTVVERELTSSTNVENIFVITGLDSIRNKLESAQKLDLDKLLNDLANTTNVYVTVVDTVDKIKSMEYEPFYKNNVNTSFSLWIGSGIGNQFTLKTNSSSKETRMNIENDFGFIIVKGNPKLVKLIDFLPKDVQ